MAEVTEKHICFCGPCSDRVSALSQDQRRLLTMLSKLANEAAGFLGMSDIERHGQTNSRILRDRIEKARDLMRELQPETDEDCRSNQ